MTIKTRGLPAELSGVGHRLAIENRLELIVGLSESGAIVLKGCGIAVGELSQFACNFSDSVPFDYAGGASPRTRLMNAAYTSTEYPSEMTLALHNELSYSARAPRYLFFLCVVPPADRGETTLGDSRKILQELDPEIVSAFRSRGVRHERHLPGDGSMYSWQSAFDTSDREAVEQKLEDVGSSFTWRADGGLCLSETTDATLMHPETGEEVWFNQASAFGLSPDDSSDRSLGATFGDGGPIARPMLMEVAAVLERAEVAHRWSAGDMVIVDNALAAHGRRPFSGPRQIALAMTGVIERHFRTAAMEKSRGYLPATFQRH